MEVSESTVARPSLPTISNFARQVGLLKAFFHDHPSLRLYYCQSIGSVSAAPVEGRGDLPINEYFFDAIGLVFDNGGNGAENCALILERIKSALAEALSSSSDFD